LGTSAQAISPSGRATPDAVKIPGQLVFFSPFNKVIALHPRNGAQTWRFDARIDTEQRPADRYNCRGVAFWDDIEAAKHAICHSRIIIGTNDACLIALDAKTGSLAPI
jgi:quinoprotein glucose dehydrogenase